MTWYIINYQKTTYDSRIFLSFIQIFLNFIFAFLPWNYHLLFNFYFFVSIVKSEKLIHNFFSMWNRYYKVSRSVSSESTGNLYWTEKNYPVIIWLKSVTYMHTKYNNERILYSVFSYIFLQDTKYCNMWELGGHFYIFLIIISKKIEEN